MTTYTARQLYWASIVVDTSISFFGGPTDTAKRAADVALATCLVETNLKMYANSNVPESLTLVHDAVGHDHLSVGLFQQQTPMWGTCAQCMDAAYSTGHFLRRLTAFDWTAITNGQAAQKVQGSAFPGRYAQRDADAIALRKQLWPAPPKPKPTYTVKPGDNLTNIARRLHTTVGALVAKNNISDADSISIGQVLHY